MNSVDAWLWIGYALRFAVNSLPSGSGGASRIRAEEVDGGRVGNTFSIFIQELI
jgi:hypothetical protein